MNNPPPNETEPVCPYVANSNEPCATCPKLITCLHMCGILQETLREVDVEDEPT